MVIAYSISPPDDDTFMLGDETFKPEKSAPFYDWRFGSINKPHPATCRTCGRKTDPNYLSETFKVAKRRRDITATYDGYVLVSNRFRKVCADSAIRGAEFLPLPNDSKFFWLRSTRVVTFDAARRMTRFESWCSDCDHFFSVTGATPAFLKYVPKPLKHGFYRSDLEFASGHEQSTMLLVGTKTAAILRANKLVGLFLEEVSA